VDELVEHLDESRLLVDRRLVPATGRAEPLGRFGSYLDQRVPRKPGLCLPVHIVQPRHHRRYLCRTPYDLMDPLGHRTSLDLREQVALCRPPSTTCVILCLVQGQKPDVDVRLSPVPHDVVPE
jgi:hypothetical protein